MSIPSTESPVTPPDFWRSLEERAMTPGFKAGLGDEFPEGATLWPQDLDRRQFLRLMGGSLALGGLSGCVRRSAEKIVPYVTPPEDFPGGNSAFYATAIPVEGFARGILVKSNQGRPTKIEGNPDHPESLGATDAATQAAILSLYDPDRSQVPIRSGQRSTWQAFEAEWSRMREGYIALKGRGIALLTEPTTSPTLLREIALFLRAFPNARWYQHTPLAAYEVAGMQPDYDFEQADVVFSVASDCLYRHPACLRYARAFAKGRRVEDGRSRASRFYALEATPTITGSMADLRLPASPARIRLLLDAIAQSVVGGPRVSDLSADEARFVDSLADDLKAHAPRILCVAGEEQDTDIRRWAAALNQHLGAPGFRWIRPGRSDHHPMAAGDLAALARAIEQTEVEALFLLGTNPAYTAPASLGFADLIRRVPFAVQLASLGDETGAACTWELPEAHFLEAWTDLLGYEGSPTILQPLIEPLFQGKNAQEVLRLLRVPMGASSYQIVRETWAVTGSFPDLEAQWAGWLTRGFVEGRSGTPLARPDLPVPTVATGNAESGMALILAQDPSVLDGRGSNNAWLQELPKPLTHLVWDNAALVAPALAARLGVENGDMLSLSAGALSLEAAAWVLPGQAADCVTLSLGYGRTRAGELGTGCGFNAYRLRPANDAWVVSGLSVAKTGGKYPLVTTQHHFAMEGRDPVRVVSPEELELSAPGAGPSMYPEWKSGAYSWGMSIDLSTCLGCNACVVACQAENNIPVVGKDQVSRGREMHWMRIDRYFEGSVDTPQILHQPVPCMHCENAPCELVCPVGATVHSSEGLNQMVYNRCVGTRYCSNNCPYKVRRFNFLDYRDKRDSLANLQKNPDVTVRERGVMEKCTYCVQRINAARIAADKDNRPIRDGDIRTACQQACPVEAIVFGNVADPASKVSLRKREPTHYALLAELNTRPRTTYLAKVRRGEPSFTA